MGDPARSQQPGLTAGLAFDAPSNTEWKAWLTTPRRARIYVSSLVALAGVVTVTGSSRTSMSNVRTTLLGLVLAGMANVELGRLSEGGRVERQRLHKGMSAWVFAAALLLGPGLAGWVAAASYAYADLRGIRIRRWKWIGSCAIVTLAGFASSLALGILTPAGLPAFGSVAALASVVLALGVFLAFEAGLLGIISRLNSTEDEIHLRAALAGKGFYLVECSVLMSGAAAAVLFRYSPGFLLLAGPAYLLMQRGMLHQPLRHQASHDAKTGVLHCEAWRAAAGTALAQQVRDGRPAAVLIVDVDRFKAVNDTFGHLLGDDVLIRIAEVVVGGVRKTDFVGRFGGDEFCALLVDSNAQEAIGAAERIRTQIGQLRFADPDLRVTASIGVAVAHDGRPGTDLAVLVAHADGALYEAKTAGRNRVCTGSSPAAGAFRELSRSDR